MSKVRLKIEMYEAAITAAKEKAEEWNVCDPQTSISAEAAKQIAMESVDAAMAVLETNGSLVP